MDKKEQILHYYRVDGLSLREISRRVGLNRKTSPRYVREFEKMSLQDGEDGIERYLQQKPMYSSCRKSERTHLTVAVCSEIDYWLEENARRQLKRLHKQCLKQQDIHRMLIEKGYDISYSSVCKYLQWCNEAKTRKPREAFIKQYYEPGRDASLIVLKPDGKQPTDS